MKRYYQFLSLLLFILFASHDRSLCQTTTFSYTGSMQSWTVPAGVRAIFIDAQGAKGGAAGPVGATVTSTTPGCGGRVQANLLVTPGQVLNINIGGQGEDAVGYTTALGGYNGGGHSTPWVPTLPSFNGGGGGGKTDITSGATILIVAGGGGGAGYNGACTPGDQPGGNGGGLTGASATTCDATLTAAGFTTIRHSGGGKQTTGGLGGWICCGGYYTGTNGTSTSGGNNVDSGGIGGGGGGGYYGGGGGCWMGGGGGSSYTLPVSATSVTHTQGFNCGDGNVTICILPDPGTITGTRALCIGATSTLTTSGVSGGTWSSGNAAVASVDLTGLVTTVSTGTATISYSVSNSCGTIAATAVVTINAIPDAGTITGTDSVCPGHTDTLSNTTAGGVWSSFNPTASVGSSTGIVTGVTTGMDTIYYTVTVAGCSAKTKLPIRIRSHTACAAAVQTITNVATAIRIIPNPNQGMFTVYLLSVTEEQVHYMVTNIVGQRVSEFDGFTNTPVTMQLDVPAGVYFLTAATPHGKWTEKIMVIK